MGSSPCHWEACKRMRGPAFGTGTRVEEGVAVTFNALFNEFHIWVALWDHTQEANEEVDFNDKPLFSGMVQRDKLLISYTVKVEWEHRAHGGNHSQCQQATKKGAGGPTATVNLTRIGQD